MVIDHVGGVPKFIGVNNTPEAYMETFLNPSAGRSDPVMQHCKTRGVPIVWDQATYVASGAGEKWEEQAFFGYKSGIALAMHMPAGKHFFLGVDRDDFMAPDEAELSGLVADLHLFAVHANEAASRILMPSTKETAAPVLAPREIECLRWTMEGKTAWEAGAILGLAESTVVFYLRNAMRKLKCVNKQQAVVRALRLGLIR